jgi:hypothetical protein
MLTRFGVLAFLLLAPYFSGCVTYHSPSRLSASEQNVVKNAGLSHLTIGVVSNSEANKEQTAVFAQKITRTGLFNEVNLVSQLISKPDILIKLEPSHRRFYCATGAGSIVIPTTGIIPFNVGHDENIEFTLLSNDQTKIVPFIYSHKGAAWWGTVISLLAVLPDWSLNKIDEDRHTQRLAFLLASHNDEILSLVKSTRD